MSKTWEEWRKLALAGESSDDLNTTILKLPKQVSRPLHSWEISEDSKKQTKTVKLDVPVQYIVLDDATRKVPKADKKL